MFSFLGLATLLYVLSICVALSTILVKNIFPNVDLHGYYSGLSASKYAWLNIGEEEGTLQWEQKCEK